MIPDDFTAIDFETADRGYDSACAWGFVRVERGRIVERGGSLIRPPRVSARYLSIHGIEQDRMVAAQPVPQVWHQLGPLLRAARVMVAHHAPFDRGVLLGTCERYGIRAPRFDWLCTAELAREQLGITPANLPHVCRVLEIPLRHHDPTSDAEAAARIALFARARSS